jgi:hypothetical protein
LFPSKEYYCPADSEFNFFPRVSTSFGTVVKLAINVKQKNLAERRKHRNFVGKKPTMQLVVGRVITARGFIFFPNGYTSANAE